MNGSQRISPSLSEKLYLQQGELRTKAGFTLLEVMIVVSLLGILTAIAAPAFQTWIEHSAVNNATNTLYLKFKQARTLAVAEGRNVKVSLDTVNNAFVYDDDSAGACSYCKHEAISLSQFSPNVVLTSNQASVAFNTLGTTVDAGTIKLTIGGYSKCIIINFIGRARTETCL